MVSTGQAKTVKTRRVFYIPGYDPIHPRRYRELYRKEGAAQAAISGYEIALKPKAGKGNYGWRVNAGIDGHQVTSQVEVLVWSDIVRESMSNSIPATYWQLLRTAWVYIGSGALWRLMRLRKGPVIAALYPVGMLIVQALLAVALGLLTYRALEMVTDHRAARLAFAAVGTGLGIALLRWFKKKDGKFFAYYLMHDYAYSAATRGANPPELEARMAQFGNDIAAALTDDVDEVLVVGHSSGAHLGVSVLADLIRAGRVPERGPALGFLSLGQVVPMVSFLPRAERLRGDLRYLSTREELAWVDVTAPGDGCAFALCDPVAVRHSCVCALAESILADRTPLPWRSSASLSPDLNPGSVHRPPVRAMQSSQRDCTRFANQAVVRSRVILGLSSLMPGRIWRATRSPASASARAYSRR